MGCNWTVLASEHTSPDVPRFGLTLQLRYRAHDPLRDVIAGLYREGYISQESALAAVPSLTREQLQSAEVRSGSLFYLSES